MLYRAPSPPASRRKRHRSDSPGSGRDDDDAGAPVSHLLQGEIARLHKKFTVDLDTFYHNQSKAVHLICKLGRFKYNKQKGTLLVFKL